MPLWRCPHCGTPQAETSRCWVCRRSTTSCVTCRHFRRGVAGGLGLCGLDLRRAALRGDEIRACWTAPDPPAVITPERLGMPVPVMAGGSQAAHAASRGRTFVPVDELERASAPVATADPPGPAAPAPPYPERGWSLWDDAEA
jgi:hypothetical protein